MTTSATSAPAPDDESKHDDPQRLEALPPPTPEDRNLKEIAESEQGLASSHNSRINVPLNLRNWKDKPEAVVEELMWFHQYILDQELTWEEAAEAIHGDRSTVFRVLKGTYQAKDWSGIAERIRSFRELTKKRMVIQKNVFVPNRISRLIDGGLDYAMANNSITLIVGESRLGKSEAARDWKRRNNHGRTVMIEVPPQGGPRAVLMEIAKAVGVNRNASVATIQESIVRAFNANRMLIVDEVHRTLPGTRGATPIALETIRYIRDKSDCAVGLLATQRFNASLRKGSYQYEQLIGRIGMPIGLPHTVIADDILPIVTQYVPNPSDRLMDVLLNVANKPGRLGVLVETLKFGSRIAAKNKAKLAEKHIFDSLAFRKQMQGEGIDFAD